MVGGQYVDLGIPGIVEAVAVGSGGVATVYRAVQTQLNRTVAVKVVQGSRDPATTRRFEREAGALGSLSEHPGIVTLYSTGTTASDQPYFIMQYCPQGSLQDQLNAGGARCGLAARRDLVSREWRCDSAGAAGLGVGDWK